MLTLYQFRSCPFCGKVRAFLSLNRIPYTVVEVSPFGMKELEFSTHKKVPVLRDGEQVIVESAAIVDYLNTQYAHLPLTEQDREWTQWIDQRLVHYLPPLLHPNGRHSFRHLGVVLGPQAGGRVRGFVNRVMGALIMPRVARRMQTKHAIQDPAAEFRAALQHWSEQGLAGNNFYAGTRPGLVDSSVFGVLASTAGTGIVEAASADNPAFRRWYRAMQELLT